MVEQSRYREAGGGSWSVDSWFRPNGHLPFVMPLHDWERDQAPWDPPFTEQNPNPRYSSQLCVP